jgi:hypothetical protein
VFQFGQNRVDDGRNLFDQRNPVVDVDGELCPELQDVRERQPRNPVDYAVQDDSRKIGVTRLLVANSRRYRGDEVLAVGE